MNDSQSAASTAATIVRFEGRLAETQRVVRQFGAALTAAADGLEPKTRDTLVVTTDVAEAGQDEPMHAVTVTLTVYGYTATVKADGKERLAATSSLPPLAERFAAIDGARLRGDVPLLCAGSGTMSATQFLETTIAAVAEDLTRRSETYNPAL